MDGLADDELYRLAAGAEQLSEHPLGKAVVMSLMESGKAAPKDIEDFRMLPGRGVTARVEGHTVMAGNLELLREQGILDTGGLADAAASYLEAASQVTAGFQE